MNAFSKNINIGLIALSISIFFSSLFIGYSLQTYNKSKDTVVSSSKTNIESEILTISELAEYMKLSEDEIKGIIDLEQEELHKWHSFTGIMFPYIIVNEKYYFYKSSVNEWIKESVRDARDYDTVNKSLNH